MDETSMTWFRLRQRRVSLLTKSKLSESAARQKTFAAAMIQFEELMKAAKISTCATRPLNLYYSLAQAGMAIAAARAPDPWSFNSHGLKVVDTRADLSDMQVRTEGTGAFQKVATATGSPGVAEPVSLGALWASLPDLLGAQAPGSTAPIALDLLGDLTSGVPRASLFVPAGMIEHGVDVPRRVYEIIAEYPGAAGAQIPVERDAIQPPGSEGGRWLITLEWPSPNPALEMSQDEVRAFLDGIIPEYVYNEDRYLRPAIEHGLQPPSPLMTWWLLMFSFSILARYQPRKWMALLDLDRSECAVPLEYALEIALMALPRLVLEALDGHSLLLSKPLSV